MATLLLILPTPMQCFSIIDGDFPPLKHSSSVNVSKSNNGYSIIKNDRNRNGGGFIHYIGNDLI